MCVYIQFLTATLRCNLHTVNHIYLKGTIQEGLTYVYTLTPVYTYVYIFYDCLAAVENMVLGQTMIPMVIFF